MRASSSETRSGDPATGGGAQPFFSIVIPTYDRPGSLTSCLESVARLDYPRERFEVLVVDDGSPTPPEAVVAGLADRMDVRLVSRPHAGQSAARNAGAARARGDYIAFTDDDCWPSRAWLKELAARFMDAPDDAVGGRTENAFPDNCYSATSQAVIDFVYSHYNRDSDNIRFFVSNNLAVPTRPFRELGGFNESFTTSEDRELCDRWLASGQRMAYAPEAVVYHASELTFRRFVLQHFNYGRGAFRFHQSQRHGSGLWRSIAFHLELVNLRKCPVWRAPGRHRWRRPALVLMWQAANAAGYLRETLRGGRSRPGMGTLDPLPALGEGRMRGP